MGCHHRGLGQILKSSFTQDPRPYSPAVKEGKRLILIEYKTTTVRTFELAESAGALNVHAGEGWNIHATVPDWDIKDRIIVIWEREATNPEAQEVPAISPREAQVKSKSEMNKTLHSLGKLEFPEAWDALRLCLSKDKELAEGYIANVGMVLYDHFSHADFSCPKTRDHAAKMILGHMFDIDFEKTSLEELKKHRR